jgi:hypothetical protein
MVEVGDWVEFSRLTSELVSGVVISREEDLLYIRIHSRHGTTGDATVTIRESDLLMGLSIETNEAVGDITPTRLLHATFVSTKFQTELNTDLSHRQIISEECSNSSLNAVMNRTIRESNYEVRCAKCGKVLDRLYIKNVGLIPLH